VDKCIFCMISKKEIPAQIIYENDYVISFLDINPIARGHCLVIPKKHYVDVFDISQEYLKEIISAVKIVSEIIKRNLGVSGVNILNASGKDSQQSVFHFHFHIVPRFAGDGLDTWPKSNYKEVNIGEVRELLSGK